MSNETDELDSEFDDGQEFEGPNPYDEPEQKTKVAWANEQTFCGMCWLLEWSGG